MAVGVKEGEVPRDYQEIGVFDENADSDFAEAEQDFLVLPDQTVLPGLRRLVKGGHRYSPKMRYGVHQLWAKTEGCYWMEQAKEEASKGQKDGSSGHVVMVVHRVRKGAFGETFEKSSKFQSDHQDEDRDATFQWAAGEVVETEFVEAAVLRWHQVDHT